MTKKTNYLIDVIKRKCKSKHYTEFDTIEKNYIYDLCIQLGKMMEAAEKVEKWKKYNE